MNEIWLNNLELKISTEQDALDYCQLNNINPDNITELYLLNNELIDISGLKLFKNLEALYLGDNYFKDIFFLSNFTQLKELDISSNKYLNNISEVKYSRNLEYLDISNLKLESDQIQYINSLKNLKELRCYNGFKDMSVLNELNKNIIIDKIFKI